MWRLRHGHVPARLAPALFGLVLGTGAVLLEVALSSVLLPAPFLLLYPAVFIAAWFCGRTAGLLALLVGIMAAPYCLLAPVGVLGIELARDVVDLFIFGGTSLAIVLLVARMREALREANAAKLEAERANAAKDTVLAVVAHDLRSPLQTIGLSVERLSKELPASDEAGQKTLTRMGRAVKQTRFLVENVLESAQFLTSPFHVEPATWPLADVVQESLGPFRHLAEARSIALVVPGAEALGGDIVCDRDRIAQVLSNLVGNAIQYTPRGGTVRVDARRLADGIELTVADDGPGMSQEDLTHAFERGWRGRQRAKGTGLGLWIAKSLVEAHRGRIAATSKPGHGTSVSFVLPQPTGEPVSATAPLGPLAPTPAR